MKKQERKINRGKRYLSYKDTPGLRWIEHKSRKYGIMPDRYFYIYYSVNGKRREEGIGWESESHSERDVLKELHEIKKNIKLGTGYQSLKEKREIEQQRRDAEEADREQSEKAAITFSQFYKDSYLPILETSKKPGSIHAEKILFEKWINPYIGAMPFKDIYPLHIEKIKKVMTTEPDKEKAPLAKKKSPRSIEYVLSVIRQIWNLAKRDGLIDRESPTKQVKKPKYDNKRLAFFTHEQADVLLEKLKGINEALQKKSKKTKDKTFKIKAEQLHNMALISLHTGMRAGELFKLKWAYVNLKEGLIMIKDAKGGSRVAYMTKEVKEMLETIKPEENHADELVFTSNKGTEIIQISESFDRVITDLKFNEGITDRRQKLTFHSLRHTYASWLVMQGTPLYTVQLLLGHKSMAMTMRYAHLAPDTLKAAVSIFEKNLKKQKKAKVINLKR